MTLLQRAIFSCFYVLFNQGFPPEDHLKATLYPFSHKRDFNFVAKYLFASEEKFYESDKLNLRKIAIFENPQKCQNPVNPKVCEMTLLI